MHDPQEVRNLSRECRERAKTAIEPDVIDQLRIWTVELADEADEMERSHEGAPNGAARRIIDREEPAS